MAKNQRETKLLFWAVAALGEGLSGGDRIFIELARRWSRRYLVTIYTWTEGLEMAKRQKLSSTEKLKFILIQTTLVCRLGFFVCYWCRTLGAIIESIKVLLKLRRLDKDEKIILYSASEFWMDSLPAFVIRLFNKKTKWVAAWYQTAPTPWTGFTQGGERSSNYKLRALFYWLIQLPIRPLIDNFADCVLVNNDNEKAAFPKLRLRNRVKVVLGAVNTKEIELWQQQEDRSFPKIYDAVFQGRFHPQKGVIELVEIWHQVVSSKPNAKLAMIGDGPLMSEVREKIKQLKLEKNIYLLGYLFDGQIKYKTFSQSKVVVHPAFFDSGGMASAEAMAFGLPCVGFDLSAYRYYYPVGMIKVAEGDMTAFANAINQLLDDAKLYSKLSKEAKEAISSKWSWDNRANEVLDFIL